MNQISHLVIESHYSPYAIIQHFDTNGWPSKTRICEKTLYTYIAAGYVPDISNKNLLLAGKRRKPRDKPARHSRAANALRSIDTRPQEINDRSVVGHWEGDTVYSGKECSPACLLTLTERKTKAEIVRKIPDRTAKSIKAEFDKMERQMGSVRFRDLFRSCSFDNGAEFADTKGLEGSILCLLPRTQLFFAHPYCSSERGTNENHNGIIRRFISKGCDIGLVNKKTIRETQDWMNIYSRKILNGMIPLMKLKLEMGEGFSIPSFMEVRE